MRIIACSSAVSSSDLAETPRAYGRRLAGQQREAIVVDHQQQPIAHHRRPRRGDIERHDRDIFARDVLPDVELGPVRDREDADALALRLAGVVEVPQFGALLLGIPAVRRRAEGENAFLGAALFLVAARAAEGDVETVEVERLLRSEEHTSELQSLMRISY